LEFRSQITTPIEKIMETVDRLSLQYADPSKKDKFAEIIETLRESSDLGNSIADLIVKIGIGSPIVIAFIIFAKTHGIDVPW
jgi:hypothetical protein